MSDLNIYYKKIIESYRKEIYELKENLIYNQWVRENQKKEIERLKYEIEQLKKESRNGT